MRQGIFLALVSGVAVVATSVATGNQVAPTNAAEPRQVPEGAAAPHQGFARVTPEADTFIAPGLRDPLGHLATLIFGNRSAGDYVTLIKFPMPMDRIGEGSTITQGILKLYKWQACDIDDPGEVAIELRTLTRAFKESNPQGTVFTSRPTSAGPVFRMNVPNPEQIGWFEIDVTQSVQRWYSGDITNHGFEIIPTFTGRNRTCNVRSREIGSYPLAQPPLLEISWTGGVTQTPTPSLTPTASLTPTPSNTPTASMTPTASDTPDVTDTPTATHTATPHPGIYLPLTLNEWDIRELPTAAPGATTAVPSTAEATPTSGDPTDEPVTPTDEPEVTQTPSVEPAETNTPTPQAAGPRGSGGSSHGILGRLLRRLWPG